MAQSPEKLAVKPTVEARQAAPGYNIYVLGMSLAGIVVLFAIIYLYFFS